MIRHGASQVLENTDSTITSDSITDIIQRSMQKTLELETKYKDMGLDDLQKFTLDGSGTVYKWEGEDFSNKRKASGFWIQPAKRERKVNYGVNEYYRDVLKTGGRTGPNKVLPPRPKQSQCFDFQFFPTRLLFLQEREVLAYQQEVGYKLPELVVKEGEDSIDPDLERIHREEQEKIDTAVPLNEAELAERETLFKQGFNDWSKKEFQLFCKGCEKFGRDKIREIASEVEGKTYEQVEKYAGVFWKRYQEIAGIIQ